MRSSSSRPVLEADGSGVDPYISFSGWVGIDGDYLWREAFKRNVSMRTERHGFLWLRRRFVFRGTVASLNRFLEAVWEYPGVAESVTRSALDADS